MYYYVIREVACLSGILVFPPELFTRRAKAPRALSLSVDHPVLISSNKLYRTGPFVISPHMPAAYTEASYAYCCERPALPSQPEQHETGLYIERHFGSTTRWPFSRLTH